MERIDRQLVEGIIHRACVVFVGFCLFMPLFAQANSGTLKESIRTNLMADPSAALLTEGEISDLVESLAMKAAAEGVTPDEFATATPYSVEKGEPATPGEKPGAAALSIIATLGTLVILYTAWRVLEGSKGA